MKKSDIEKQLKKDLSAAAPSDFNSVWNKCETPSSEKVPAAVLATATAHGGQNSYAHRKAVSFTALALAVLCVCAAAICLIFFLKGDGGLVKPSVGGYFLIDVNPSVKVSYDTNGLITSSEGLNADGEQLLDGLELEGVTYDNAVNMIFERSVSLGYFSAEQDDNAILMTANKNSGEKDEQMTAEIGKYFAQSFNSKNMKGIVISDTDNAKWQKEADKYGISGQKYELILRFKEKGGTIDEAEYETITIRELYSLISENSKGDKDK